MFENFFVKKENETKYCVIHRQDDKCGLFSFFITNLGGIHWCINNGKIPIIDMQSTRNLYLEEDEVGKLNAWEKWFEQPMGVGLEVCVNKKNIEYIDGCLEMRPNLTMDFLTNEGLVNYWRELSRKYIRLNASTMQFIEHCKEKVFGNMNRQNILGILCRGTDYITLRPPNHPVQPDCAMVICKAKEILQQYHCDAIYLATEDQFIISKFREEFGEKLLFSLGNKYGDTNNKYLADFFAENGIQQNTQGIEYLASIYCLAQCGYMLAGRTSGSVAALLLSEGFKYCYFWNLGKYQIDEEYSRRGLKCFDKAIR